jgi:hypothetical protein
MEKAKLSKPTELPAAPQLDPQTRRVIEAHLRVLLAEVGRLRVLLGEEPPPEKSSSAVGRVVVGSLSPKGS